MRVWKVSPLAAPASCVEHRSWRCPISSDLKPHQDKVQVRAGRSLRLSIQCKKGFLCSRSTSQRRHCLPEFSVHLRVLGAFTPVWKCLQRLLSVSCALAGASPSHFSFLCFWWGRPDFSRTIHLSDNECSHVLLWIQWRWIYYEYDWCFYSLEQHDRIQLIFAFHLGISYFSCTAAGEQQSVWATVDVHLQSIFFVVVHMERCPSIECQCFFFLIYIDKQP